MANLRNYTFLTLFSSLMLSTYVVASDEAEPNEKRQRTGGGFLEEDALEIQESVTETKRARATTAVESAVAPIRVKKHKGKVKSINSPSYDLLEEGLRNKFFEQMHRIGLPKLFSQKIDLYYALLNQTQDDLDRFVSRVVLLSDIKIKEAIAIVIKHVTNKNLNATQGGLFLKGLLKSDCQGLAQLSKTLSRLSGEGRGGYFRLTDMLNVPNLTVFHDLMTESDENLNRKLRMGPSTKLNNLADTLATVPPQTVGTIFPRVHFLSQLDGLAVHRLEIVQGCLALPLERAIQILNAVQKMPQMNSAMYAKKIFELLKIIPAEDFDSIVGQLQSFMCAQYVFSTDWGDRGYPQLKAILTLGGSLFLDPILVKSMVKPTTEEKFNLYEALVNLPMDSREILVKSAIKLVKGDRRKYESITFSVDTFWVLLARLSDYYYSINVDEEVFNRNISSMISVVSDFVTSRVKGEAEESPSQVNIGFDLLVRWLTGANFDKLDEVRTKVLLHLPEVMPDLEKYTTVLKTLSNAQHLTDNDLETASRIMATLVNPRASMYRELLEAYDMMPANRKDSIPQLCESLQGLTEADDYGNIILILHAIPFIPYEQIYTFVSVATGLLFNDENQDLSSLESLLVAYLEEGASLYDGFSQIALYDYWNECLNGDNNFMLKHLSRFILDNFHQLDLHDDHPLFVKAQEVLTLLSEDLGRTPHASYIELTKKRQQSIDWDSLDMGQAVIDGMTLSLVPKEVARFGGAMSMDLSTVPAFTEDMFTAMVQDLEDDILTDQFLMITDPMRAWLLIPLLRNPPQEGLPLIVQAALMTSQKSVSPDEQIEDDPSFFKNDDTVGRLVDVYGNQFLNILASEKYQNSYMRRLLRQQDPLHIEASKLKCVMSFLNGIQDSTEKIQRLMQFFAGVRFCETGHDTAVQDYYVNLPVQNRIQSTLGTFEGTGLRYPALRLLHSALQSVISSHFSPEARFMKELCEVEADGEISQAAHQILYAKGLIGDKVGLTDKPKFDIHSGVVNRTLYNASLMYVLGLYYENFNLDSFMIRLLEKMNSLLKECSPDQKRDIHMALADLHSSLKLEDYSKWVSFNFVDDEDYEGELDQIHMRGLVRLLLSIGIVRDLPSKSQ